MSNKKLSNTLTYIGWMFSINKEIGHQLPLKQQTNPSIILPIFHLENKVRVKGRDCYEYGQQQGISILGELVVKTKLEMIF